MKRFWILATTLACIAGCSSNERQTASNPASDSATASPSTTDATAPESETDPMATTSEKTGPLSFTMVDIDGNEVDLAKYQGQVVMIVNVASKCGLTPQYKQLQALHEKYNDQGLAILGFPANNFLGQEPGSNEKIKEFCTTQYGVEFDMFAKISVKGDDKHPLYAYLTAEDAGHTFGGDIDWNFAKFLVGRDGQLTARFSAKTKPDAPEVVSAIETALGQGA